MKLGEFVFGVLAAVGVYIVVVQVVFPTLFGVATALFGGFAPGLSALLAPYAGAIAAAYAGGRIW
jgi:uncharacterized membrane protein